MSVRICCAYPRACCPNLSKSKRRANEIEIYCQIWRYTEKVHRVYKMYVSTPPFEQWERYSSGLSNDTAKYYGCSIRFKHKCKIRWTYWGLSQRKNSSSTFQFKFTSVHTQHTNANSDRSSLSIAILSSAWNIQPITYLDTVVYTVVHAIIVSENVNDRMTQWWEIKLITKSAQPHVLLHRPTWHCMRQFKSSTVISMSKIN